MEKLNQRLKTGFVLASLFLSPLGAFAASPMETARIQDIARDGLAEVALGKLAQERTKDPAVKAFAEHMVKDHSKANEELQSAAQKDGIALPTEPSPAQKQKLKYLSGLSGKSFDTKYMTEMVEGHNKAVKAFELESTKGTASLKSFAASHLPTIQQHDKEAKETIGKL